MVKPSPGTTKFSRRRSIGLGEWIEDRILLRGRNPDTRVADGKLESGAVFRALRQAYAVCGKTDIEHDLTLCRKLYGI